MLHFLVGPHRACSALLGLLGLVGLLELHCVWWVWPCLSEPNWLQLDLDESGSPVPGLGSVSLGLVEHG